MSTAIDNILASFSSDIEIAVEIDSANRTNGTLKTWYFSTHPRETGSSETPASTSFLPFVKPGGVLGPLTQSLSEDVMFSGLAENNPGNITLIQSLPDDDELSEMNDYVFAGYSVRIKIGLSANLYATFETFRTITVSIDPIIQLTSEGLTATFQLQSATKRLLEEPLIVKRHLGIPHCLRFLTATGRADVTKVSAHDVKSFTVGIRFRMSAAPAVARRIWSKLVSGTNTHWFFAVQTNGTVTLTSTSNLASDISFTSSNICDNSWHSLIFSRDNATTAYVMIDFGSETTYTPAGEVDLSNANLIFGLSAGGDDMDVCDARFLDRYMTADEARAYFATRSNGDDLNVIGLWRFDDNSGGTVNDYSSLNADAVISGVLNTDYSWQPTDLGEPELAGRVYPLTIGNVLNAPAQLIDSNRERYRGNNDAIGWFTSGSNYNLTVRSQGTVLTGGGVDYTAPGSGGDGVFNMTSQEAEPVTFDLVSNGTNEQVTYPSKVAENILSRTRISSISNQDNISLLAPWPSGYFTDQEATAQSALAEVLGQAGLYYRETDLGSIWMDMLLPPSGYGPYGEPAYDFCGTENGIGFGNVGGTSSSMTVAAWVKVNLADQTAYNFGTAGYGVGTLYIAAKQDATGNYSLFFNAIGPDAGKLEFRTGSVSVKSATGSIQPYKWYFVAGVFDDTNNMMWLYLGEKGSALKLIAGAANSNFPFTNGAPLSIGGNGYSWFAVQHVHVWNNAKNLSQLQALMTTPPVGNESGLLAYIPLNEGEGLPYEKVSNVQGTIFESTLPAPKWVPKLVIDLTETPSVKLSDFHHTHPASDIVVKYSKNRLPMDSSDIDSGVSQTNRLNLMLEGRDVRFESSVIRSRFKNAKRIILDTSIIDQESAIRLLRVMSSRFSTDRYVGTVKFPSGLNISRLACGLELGDEVGLVGTIPSQIQTPRSFRVASCAPNLLKLEQTINIFG